MRYEVSAIGNLDNFAKIASGEQVCGVRMRRARIPGEGCLNLDSSDLGIMGWIKKDCEIVELNRSD